MALKCIVKVGSISNLSDARYCAGMGVDILGFNINKDAAEYVSQDKLTEIKGWISGPLIALEADHVSQNQFNELLTGYEFDLIETDLQSAKQLQSGDKSIMLRLKKEDEPNLHLLDTISQISYIIIPENLLYLQQQINGQIKLLVEANGEANRDIELSESTYTHGIALRGSIESKPGFKDYDHLADVLEALETE
jgi:phosphoribosylanthranilate isomerase